MPPLKVLKKTSAYAAARVLIPLKNERLRSSDVLAQERRAPELLDVFNDQVSAGEMIDTRRAVVIIHRVRQIADQGDVLAKIDHLPDCERAPKHTHVQVHAADNDIVNAAFLEKVPDLLAIVRNGVLG